MLQLKADETEPDARRPRSGLEALPADVDQTLVGFLAAIGVVFAVALALFAALSGRHFVAAAILVVALSIGVALESARRAAVTFRQLNLTLAVVAVALMLALLLSGATTPSSVVLLSLLPFIMAALGNRRGMLVWFAVSLVILVVVFFHAPYATSHYTEPAKDPVVYHYVIVGVLTLFITTTAYVLMGKRHRYLRELALTNQRLSTARDESRLAHQAKSEFLGRMSHELRTPLNAILGFTELMSREETSNLTGDQRQKVAYVQMSGQRLLKIVDEILDITSHDARRTFMALFPTAVAPLVSAAVREAEAASQRDDIAIHIAASAQGTVCVVADSKSLLRALSELIQNAIKFNADAGRIDISVETHGDMATIHVADTGHGIPPAALSELFDPFSRSLTRDGDAGNDGAGLGLAMVRAIIEHMNGRISVESKLGVGSRFTVHLPISRPLDDTSISPSTATTAINGDADVTGNVRREDPADILYVEDNALNKLVMSALISDLDLGQLHIAATGAEALELVTTLKPKLLLVDIHLPDCTGIELLPRLRAVDGYDDIPAIAVSADAMPEHIEAALAAGFNQYLTKPVSVAALREAVERHSRVAVSPSILP